MNNEAFERARSAYGTGAYDDATMEFIFPQLAESEDERIRKELLEVIRHCYEDGGYTLCTDDYKKYSSYLEKQKEQKPAEWSEEEKIRKWIIDEIKATHDYDSPTSRKCVDDALTYLEKQKEQKPTECSEEDEDMLNSCISSIEEAKENRYAYKETDGDTSYDHEIAWLKSLRNRVGKEFLQPHWKPSEEQMETLNEVAGDYRAEDTASCEKTADILESLYHDLQKLL